MTPVNFPEANVIFAKDQPQYLPLPAFRTAEGAVVTCWELSSEELSKIQSTGKFWLTQITFNHPLQPILPQVEMPVLAKGV